MIKRRALALSIGLLALLLGDAAQAQDGTGTTQAVSLAETLSILSGVAGSGQAGDFLRVGTALEVATTPFGTSSGGFVFKVDPTTGLEVRTASTFGPSFAERALTAGAGQVSVAVNLIVATYDKIGSARLEQMQLASSVSPLPENTQTGFMSLVLSSESTVIQGVMGATDKLDVGVIVPIVRVKVNGIAWVQNAVVRQQNGQPTPDILTRASGRGVSTGIGDLALTAKYRLLRFGGAAPPDAPLEPDPGGLALLSTVRLPTGSRENLRGLGVTRALMSLIASGGQGRFRPHVNVGFEWWDKGVHISAPRDATVTTRHQVQYGAGVELEASPKLTLLVDVLGRHILGGGRVGSRTAGPAERPDLVAARVSSVTYAVGIDEGIRKLSIVPGVKWNLKGKFLLSLSGIATISDHGLHDLFTPVVGIDWSF